MAPWTAPMQGQKWPRPPAGRPPMNLVQNRPFGQPSGMGGFGPRPAAAPNKPAVAPNKPAVAPRPTGPAAGGAGGPALTVSSQSKNDDIGIQTLVGDYADKGSNHGKKYYQKVQKIPGHEDISVFLYYWDARDGADFSGWWFGDSLGGSQVWARSPTHGPQPPRIGWRIPWDAPKAEIGILMVDQYSPSKSSAALASGTAAASGAKPAVGAALSAADASRSALEKSKAAATKVDAAEKLANDSLNRARGLAAANPDDEECLKEAQQLLQAQVTALTEVQKDVAKLISEVGKSGQAAPELAKLPPRVRTVQASVTAELTKMKALVVKAAQAAAIAKKEAATAEQQKKVSDEQKLLEEKDAEALLQSLPAALELVSAAEDVVDSVIVMAAPLIAEPPDEQGDVLKKAMTEIEAASFDGQNKITEARKQINLMLQGARKYAPETRKNALSEFSSMQQKLTEAQKKLNPYKTFRKDFRQRVEAKKALQDIGMKLSAAELEVEKATMISSAAEQGPMSEDEVQAAEKLVTPAQQGITAAMQIVEQKLRTPQAQTDPMLKDELNQMKERGDAHRKKLEGVVGVIKRQREGLAAQKNIELAVEKADKAEESLAKCEAAEMPYLKGIEVLPAEESTKAISESEKAAKQAEECINQAKSFVRTKLNDTKRYTKELTTVISEQLNEIMKRVEGSAKKLEKFKGETLERKLASIMSGVVEAVSQAEKKIEDFKEATEVFASEDLHEVAIDALKAANEKAPAAEKEASAACQEARRLVGLKQKEAKGPDAQQALGKLNARLNAAQQDLAKLKKTAQTGEKTIKAKEVCAEESENIAKAEADIDRVEKLVNPEEGEKLSDTAIQEMDATLAAAQKTLKSATRNVDAQVPGAAPAPKLDLQKLSDQGKKALERITKVQSSTKDQRERVLCEVYIKEGKAKADEVEEAAEKVNDAELPFLKGIEILPLQEATGTIQESEAAAEALQKAISTARTYVASKNLEVKGFAEAVSKPTVEEFAKLTERINSAAAKLGQFRKDTEGRKKTAQMQEAAEKIDRLEEDIKKLAEESEPLAKLSKKGKETIAPTAAKAPPPTPPEGLEGKDAKEGEKKEEAKKDEAEDAPAMSEQETADLWEKCSAQMKEVLASADEAKKFLAERKISSRGSAAHSEMLQALQVRLNAAAADFAKTKAVVSEHEQKFTARRVLCEATEMVAKAVKEAESITELVAPLVEHGGEEFLVSTSVDTLAAVVREHMKESGVSEEVILRELGGDNVDVFVAGLEKLPEKLQREEIVFSEPRRRAIFKHLDADKDGVLGVSDFKGMFSKRYVCVRDITVTDTFGVADSKTVGKMEPNEILEALGEPAKEEASGMTRLECKNVATGLAGFVTVQGNQGTAFVEPFSPFTEFSAKMDKGFTDSLQAVAKITTFMRTKLTELGTAASGPLAEARAEIAKLRPKAVAAETGIRTLKAKAESAKKEFLKKEQAEKNAHLEARERKEAEAIVKVATAKTDAVDEAVKYFDEVIAPVASLKGSALKEFAKPATLLKECEGKVAATGVAVEAARACIKEQMEAVGKALKGPMSEAKRDLVRMQMKVDSAAKKSTSSLASLRNLCQSIVTIRSAEASAKLRNEVLKRGITIEGYFTELLKTGEERISEEAFCSHLANVEGLNIPPEQATLVCRHLEAGGVGKRRFCSFLQQYYMVVKSIAITNDLDVGKGKTIRKADIDEVVEILEGPVTDEKIGLTRIRGKSLLDGKEGWITVKGNHGTPYLQEVEKPYLSCSEAMPMEGSFASEDGEAPAMLRTLEKDEVLELLEGPRKNVLGNGLRARGKTASDGQTGWFTIKAPNGTTLAEADGRYYTCSAPVVLTDILDIKECKVVRKLAIGEMLLMEEGPVAEEAAKVTRVRGRALKDDKEGWITIKGSAGTVYAEASTKHYTILAETPLQKTFSSSSSEQVRVLAKGEAVQVLEGPKEETFQPELRVKGRAVSDGTMGWVTMKNSNLKSWSPFRKCSKATPLHDACNPEDATVLRQLEVGETAELLEGPVEEGKEQRIKVRAEKDGVVGWVTLKDGEGKANFKS